MNRLEIMKRRILLLVLAAVFVLPAVARTPLQQRLEKLERAVEVTPLESTRFDEKYELVLRQPLDWQAPEKGSFTHRIVVSHAGFDRPTILVTEGYGAKYAYRPDYREELSQLLDANIVFVEHRYFLGSTPDPRDWHYLTAEASACDLHDVRQLLGAIYPGKWIATGISKGGTTTMLYAAYFPGDVDIYVPYVGPVCHAVEDKRFAPFLAQVGTAESRAAVREFQREVFRRKADLMPGFRAVCEQKGYAFRVPVEEIFDYCTLELGFSLWQWGFDPEKLPSAEASDEEVLDFLVANAGPDYFSSGNAQAPFFVQAARELGYYPYDAEPFREYTSVDTRDYLRRLFLPEELRGTKFSKKLGRKITRYLKRNDPRMIFIYGGDDPWTAPGAAWAATPGKRNMKAFVQPGGSHRTRIATLPDSMRREAVATLRGWLAE